MKNFIPIIIGSLIIIASAMVIVRYNNSKEGIFSEIPVVIPTPETDRIDLSSSPTPSPVAPLAGGISLQIISPAANATVSVPSAVVKGTSVPGAEVFVNDAETKADANGNFSVTVSLDEGENYILVVSNDVSGNYSEKELFLTYEP